MHFDSFFSLDICKLFRRSFDLSPTFYKYLFNIEETSDLAIGDFY